ncbi:Similar to ropn1l: Ropporin-1-like protein (Danio rerio) [Cotesia congregata]|uniref:Similar to ropn1l: Ropporin-1-like protein (Danio rerio) n=1 Tax=Cotesia congregata TaxID=51543 RepID=A0A8J2H513_COTCN|nr:Similar to ropn1l: Ropporin-1-like protein (Danio rerio) [Cotesia congregata]
MAASSTRHIYSCEQITVPPALPGILKLYAKAAIKTRPYDLLEWTSRYFRAMADNKAPPVKERFEYPPFTHPTGLTPRYLKTLLNQFGRANSKVALDSLLVQWQGIGLEDTLLYQILMIGRLLNDQDRRQVDLYQFLAVACGFITSSLKETMIYVCELLTDEPEGGSCMIPLTTMLSIYGYLARLDCSGENPESTSTSASENLKIPDKPLRHSLLLEEHGKKNKAEEMRNKTVKKDKNETLFTSSISREDLKSKELAVMVREKSTRTQQKKLHVPLLASTGNENENEDDIADKTLSSLTLQSISDCYSNNPNYSSVKVSSKGEAKSKEVDVARLELKNHKEKPGSEGVSKERVGAGVDMKEKLGLSEIFQGIYESYQVRVKNKDLLLSSSCSSLSLNEDVGCEGEQIKEPEGNEEEDDVVGNFLKRMEKLTLRGNIDINYQVIGIGGIVTDECINNVQEWLTECGACQQGLVGPLNLRHFLCPRLNDTRGKDFN